MFISCWYNMFKLFNNVEFKSLTLYIRSTDTVNVLIFIMRDILREKKVSGFLKNIPRWAFFRIIHPLNTLWELRLSNDFTQNKSFPWNISKTWSFVKSFLAVFNIRVLPLKPRLNLYKEPQSLISIETMKSSKWSFRSWATIRQSSVLWNYQTTCYSSCRTFRRLLI